jgi:hypothetical protein
MPNLLLFADDAVRIAAVNFRNPEQSDQDDLSSYNAGRYFVKSQRRARREPFANNWDQLRWSASEALWGTAPVAFSSARSQRGEVLPSAASVGIGLASFPTLSHIISPAIRWALPFSMGAAGTAALASVLAIKPAFAIGRAAAGAIRYFRQVDYRLRHIEMGGDYQDTETALALRMRGVSEMSSAMSYSRRWLGQEASFMREQ